MDAIQTPTSVRSRILPPGYTQTASPVRRQDQPVRCKSLFNESTIYSFIQKHYNIDIYIVQDVFNEPSENNFSHIIFTNHFKFTKGSLFIIRP